MSNNPNFSILFNEIIGKEWLLKFDNSEGYVLSFKPVEHNTIQPPSTEITQAERPSVKKTFEQKSSSLVSPKKEQEEKEKPIVKETNSQNIPVKETEISKQQKHWNDNSVKKKELLDDFHKYFFNDHQKLSLFVTFMKKSGIEVEYGELSAVNPKTENENNAIRDKIRNILDIFSKELSRLQKLLEEFKYSNS